ncbi:hypothetical protein PANO111632_10885 [Paracoccus nototheniae]|uniref:Uncharacterized protein n=1 Tax=Paracoccus nototheniae TaxID=2489002 RepID=A0ABW4DR05_9RHOB|nr:hypothetical protein [Paracoccus nototheniae]
MDNDQADQASRPTSASAPTQTAPANPAPVHVGRTTLLHWAIFLGLMTALIGGAAVLF